MNGNDIILLLKKNPVGVTCGIVALLCGVTLYLGAEAIDDSRLKVEASTKQSQLMINNVRNAAGLSLAKQTEAMQRAVKQLDGRLVKASQLATNLQYFYRLESETGVKLTDLRPNQAPRGSSGFYIGVPYTVTLQGTFKQVMEFLQRIESGKHFSKYSAISFNKAAGVEVASSVLSVTINIELLGTP